MSLQQQLKNFNASVVDYAHRMPQQRRFVGNNNNGGSTSTSQVPSSTPTPTPGSDAQRKRQNADIVYSQPANTGTGKDIMTQVLFAIEHMKAKGVPLRFSDIVSYLSLQHRANDQGYIQALRRILQVHEKVQYDASGANGEGTFAFRPPHNIRTAEQLLQKLQAQSTAAGMSVRELREGWPNVEDTINRLEKEGKLLVTRNKKDDHAKMVWANDPSLVQHFDEEFRQIWEKIKIPDQQTVKEELEKAGITPTNKNKVVKARPKIEHKKVKKTRRSGKTTNTHMMGVLRDYSHLKR
ncbi:transcription factor TFIIE subunit TFA2 [Aspergillus clavatus NRRL 1]|uniref:Transcription initiation factor IIE subunit beta n=1 Tax=Aspergillus clavatus (strain ATCC 1007 / CBS 513.65 / DSM 816 / NCTC 3887 / NRRL 1 / QM 1276 / 107) TaxID=344612 RepID=A1CUF2_ASPCL|nr:transcription initiation factor TFIIE, beta subunit, putative [Aspergillus clavatus NRRL 1]EAW06939.1 transcription initiation factor TFIIE, beta subunit, putative [Aspergillus clavatus NRRL 1]